MKDKNAGTVAVVAKVRAYGAELKAIAAELRRVGGLTLQMAVTVPLVVLRGMNVFESQVSAL